MRLVGFRSGPGLLPLGRPFRRISTPGPALFSTHSRLSALPPPSSQNENQAQQQQSHPSKNNETSKSSTEAGTNQWFQQEDGAPKRPSFNSLLLQSTSMRVYKDRAEQKRFAEMRDADAARRSGIQSPYRSGILISVLTLTGIWLGYRIGSFDSGSATHNQSTLPLHMLPPPQLATDAHTLQAVWGELCSIVGPDNVSTSESDLASHATSAWQSYQPSTPDGGRPFVVVRPATTAEVSAIMKACHSRRMPVTAYAGGTSLEGHFTSLRGGVCIDFVRMDSIVALHKDDLDVVVQPGVGWETLNDILAGDNLFFPPDPGPGAMIGGMIGTGCSGTNAYHYGTMREWVLGMTVVLADGTVVKTRQRPRKSSTGYDLTKLFIGSEGTLGIVTEATLKLAPKPALTSVAVCDFTSIADAAACVSSVVEAGINVAAVELLDDVQMKYINRTGGTSRKWPERPTLFFKFAGPTQSSVREQIKSVQQIAGRYGLAGKSFRFARDDTEADELWSARKDALWSVMAMPELAAREIAASEGNSTPSPSPSSSPSSPGPAYRMWVTDVAVPISQLPTIIAESKQALVDRGLVGSIVGHVGDGNFHALIRYRPDDPAEAAAVAEVVHNMASRAIELDGTASGEHGVGLGKRDFLIQELGQPTVDLMRRIKLAVDPLCILNPDKVIRIDRDRKDE